MNKSKVTTKNLVDKFFNEGISVIFRKEEYSDRDLQAIEYFLGRLQIAIHQLTWAVTEKHKELDREAWTENYIAEK